MGRLIEIAPAPGIVRDITTNSATGRWVDCDKVRFRQGFPEKIGGWIKYSTSTFTGMARNMFTWVTLDDSILTAIGTNVKIYSEESGTFTDITPIRRTASLGANPLTSVGAGSGYITITDNTHGATVGDYVTISGATAFDGLTTANLNKEHVITSIIDANSYRVNTGGTATAGSVAGGGAGVSAAYQLNAGANGVVYGSGWGAGAWSRSAWSSAAESSTLTGSLRLWTMDNWGEDLLFAPRYGVIYRYDSSANTRGAAISTEGGASNVPTTVTEILVFSQERIVMALGCNALGSSDHDELMVRWTDYEDYLDWTPASGAAAGGFRLTAGSRIVTGLEANGQVIVWTDTAMFLISFVGGTDIFQQDMISMNTSIIGSMAKTSMRGVVYWMGERGFYAFDGRVTNLPCPIEDYVFGDLDADGRGKVFAVTNDRFNEVWWFYPSSGATECDSYVIYNTVEGVWAYGAMERTAWIDRGLYSRPRACGTDGYVYIHEYGLDDGSTDPATAISSYIESAPFEIGGDQDIGRGDRFAFVNRLIPDVTFRNSSGASPTLTYTFKKRNYNGLAYTSENTSVAKGATVDQYTGHKSIRLRARAIALRVENAEVGTDWRLGVQRFEVRTDGAKS